MHFDIEPMVDKRKHSPHTPSEPPDPQVVEAVIRRCMVCEWTGEMIESAESDPDCPWCHGPTEIAATLASSTRIVTGDKNPHAAALGRLGGLKGGRARAAALTPAQRKKIATRAARARWNKTK